MNIQHSSRTDCWYTPIEILDRVRKVLGAIDLDPASDAFGNSRVRAARYYSEAENGLTLPWYGNVFCNPPGGKDGKHSRTGLFWEKLQEESFQINHAIFLCFSLEALQITQGYGPHSIGEFPICVPARRIRFDQPDGTPGPAPSHSNAIVYVPKEPTLGPRCQKFLEVFEDLGVCLNV